MNIKEVITDEAVLAELGGRLAAVRIQLNWTQSYLAEQAGVSKRTIERLEAGSVASQLSSFIRVCRVLGLMDALDAFIPVPVASPMAQLKQAGKKRRRASGKRVAQPKLEKWTWGE